jgi:hypothetical protein
LPSTREAGIAGLRELIDKNRLDGVAAHADLLGNLSDG